MPRKEAAKKHHISSQIFTPLQKINRHHFPITNFDIYPPKISFLVGWYDLIFLRVPKHANLFLNYFSFAFNKKKYTI